VARVFVRLKLRLLRSRLATGGFLSGVGFLVIWLAAVAGGLGGGLILGVISRAAPDVIGPATVLTFAAVGLAWLVVPVVLTSVDDSLEARSFELLPLTPRQLARGLLAAGLVGPGTLATALGLGYGSLLAFGTWSTAVPLALGSATAVLLCVVSARWATARLSDLLRRRRGQEVALLVVVGLTVLPSLVAVTVAESASAEADFSGAFAALAGVVQWTPWGALGRAVAAARAGEWAVTAVGLAYGMAATVAAFWLFDRALRRLVTTPPSDVVARANRAGSRLLPKRVPLPASPVGAVAAKELIAVRRDVRVRGQLLGGIVAIIVLGVVGGAVLMGTVFAPFLSVLAVFIVVTAVTPNQLGYDGGSFWGYLTMAPDLGVVIRGKNLGWAIVGAPLAVVLAIVAAFVSGRWTYVPAALFACAVVALIWLGVGNFISIFGAFRLPETNIFGSRNLSGGAFIATMLGITVSGVLTVPPLLAVGVPAYLSEPLWATVAAAASVAYAVFVYRFSIRHASRLAHDRRFTLLATLDDD
jgi:ABC-2 type transport system permease protein